MGIDCSNTEGIYKARTISLKVKLFHIFITPWKPYYNVLLFNFERTI